MAKQFYSKLKESAISVAPIILLVIILNITPLINMTFSEMVIFLVASAIIMLGIALFSIGADMSMTPMGKSVGNGLTRKRKLGLLLIVSFIVGLLVTIAEPDLTVLATQVSDVMKSTTLIIIVGVGVALLLMLAIIKMVFKVKLSMLLMFLYFMLFALTALVIVNGNSYFLPLAFDSGGVTTGPITVPFIMALGIGVAGSLGSKDAKENSFGLIALCSAGAVISVMVAGIFINGEISYTLLDYSLSDNILKAMFVGIGLAIIAVIALAIIVVPKIIKKSKAKKQKKAEEKA